MSAPDLLYAPWFWAAVAAVVAVMIIGAVLVYLSCWDDEDDEVDLYEPYDPELGAGELPADPRRTAVDKFRREGRA